MKEKYDSRYFLKAISYLGGAPKAAVLLGIARQTLWYNYSKRSHPRLDICKKIEKLTKGKFTIKKMIPGLARDFK